MFQKVKDALVPHKGNSYRPDILERFSVGIMLVLVLLSFAIANLQALLWIGSDWLVSTILPATIVNLTNTERNGDNLTSLTRSDILDRAATLKAEDMAKNSYFAHYSPDGVSPWYWFDTVSYDYLHAGENLAVHFTDSDAVVDAWMESPTHRANIMNSDYEEIGVGSAKGIYNGHDTIFVVQLFGTKRAPLAQNTASEGAPDTEETTVTVERVSPSVEEAQVAPATVRTETLAPEVVPEGVPDTAPVSVSEVVEDIPPSSPSTLEITREGEPLRAFGEEERVVREEVSPMVPLRVATEPSLWLQTFYSILAFLVIGSLIASFMYEWHRHRIIQTAYAGGLLAVMALLLYIHTTLTGFVVIV